MHFFYFSMFALVLFVSNSKATNKRHQGQPGSEKRRRESLELKVMIQLGLKSAFALEGDSNRLAEFANSGQKYVEFDVETKSLTGKFKAYKIDKFKQMRTNVFQCDIENLLTSLCANDLKGMANPGKSGSAFFLCANEELIIKTVKVKEFRVLLRFLSDYEDHFRRNPHSLLPKFHGLFALNWHKAIQNPLLARTRPENTMRFVVMNNIFPSDAKLVKKYDLKGTTHKRKLEVKVSDTGGASIPTEKDENFTSWIRGGKQKIYLEPELHKSLESTLNEGESEFVVLIGKCSTDSKFLECQNIMDYSLLIGIEKARRHTTPADLGIVAATNGQSEQLTLYVGIIDVLSEFGKRKRGENLVKSCFYGSAAKVSVNKPDFYAKRFRWFMLNTVFNQRPDERQLQIQVPFPKPHESTILRTNLRKFSSATKT